MYTHSLIYAISAWIILIDPVASQCVPISADGSTVPGRTLATEDQTAAIGVWYKNVTSDAISTYSVCALVSTGDCAGLVDNMKATLAGILASLVMIAPPSDTESATGVPLSARRLKTGHLSKALLKDVLGKGDITFDNVWVKDGPTHRRSAGTGNTSTTFHVDGVSSQDGSKTNITLQQLDDTTGQALIVHAGSSTNHNARDIGHDPGIKVSYKLYPENLRKSVSPEDASKLAESMAKDWATRSDEVQTAANYLGLFQQRLGIIAGIELIPNYKGFGLNWEDPNAVCGSLDNYACNLGEKQCDAIAKVPPGSPMSDTTTMDTTSSASSGTTTATTSSKETAATTSDGTTTTTTPTDATKGTGTTTAVDGMSPNDVQTVAESLTAPQVLHRRWQAIQLNALSTS